MIIRTVLDLEHKTDKHLRLAILLAASYHRFNATNSSLKMEFWIIGSGSPTLDGFLHELGIIVIRTGKSTLGQSIAYANKIKATAPDPTGRPLLLIDNDILCTGSLDGLQQFATGSIRACEAGIMRVKDAQWEEIENKLGLKPLLRNYLNLWDYPPCEGSTLFRKEHLVPTRHLYVNSGVLLIPSHLQLLDMWESNVKALHNLFKDNPLSTRAVANCDQAGLAVTLGSLGSFEFLPNTYNYVDYCFVLGLADEQEIRLMHMPTNPAHVPPTGIKSYLQSYWESKIFKIMDGLETQCKPEEVARRRSIADNILSLGISIVDEYDLEHIYEKCTEEMGWS